MAITTSAGDGVRVTSSAKNNGGLDRIPALPDNQFVLPDGIAATNNGNIGLSSIAGRLITIRRNEVNEETRYITAEGGLTTGTINEDWDESPPSGTLYDISYVIEDAVTVTGFSLISKRTRDYGLGRLFSVGNDTTGTFSWFALLDGASIESDNNIGPTDRAFEIDGDGRWDFGYEQGGAAVPGGYLISTANATGEFAFGVRAGGQFRSYDLFLTSVENNAIDMVNESRMIIKGLKVYKALYQSVWEGNGLMEDLVLQGVSNTNDRLEIDESFNVDSLLLINSNGFYPNGLTTGSVLNYQSVGNLRDVENLTQGMLLRFLNPIWDGANPVITWTAATGTIEERYEYETQASAPDGSPRPNARIYLYDAFDSDFQIQTASTNATGIYSDDILTRSWATGTPNNTPTQVRGAYTQRILRYGQSPFEASLAVAAKIDQVITLVDDAGIELTEGQADGVSGTYVTEHTPNASLLLGYDGGTADFSANEIVSGSTSGAVGTVVEVNGVTADGALYLDTRNATAFTDDEPLIGHLGGAANADTAGYNIAYTWEIGANSNTMADVYSWHSSQFAKASPVSWVIEALRHRVQLLLRSGDNYSTERVDGEGVFVSSRGGGNITGLVGDDGSSYTPPTTYTLTLTDIQTASEVRIYADVSGQPGAELDGTESSSDTFSYVYTHSGTDIPVIIVIFHLDWLPIRLFIDLTNENSTIPIQQITDRVYDNP